MNQPTNDLFLRACRGESTERPPVWMMRQAGRYLPEYRAVRKKAGGFLTMVRDPEMASEVTVQPVDILSVDAAILFCDILVIPEAMGLEVTFEDGVGPVLPKRLEGDQDLDLLHEADPANNLAYVGGAISATLERLAGRVPLICFSGAPFTLACYMVDGMGTKGYPRTRAWMHQRPETFSLLLNKIADACRDYLIYQAGQGAHALQLFDSWGGILSGGDYYKIVAPVMDRLIREIKAKVNIPLISFINGGPHLLERAVQSNPDVLGTCWRLPPKDLRKVAKGMPVQGNFDPTILLTDPETIIKKTSEMVSDFGAEPGYIANLGHGLTPDVPVENARAFVETITKWKW